MTDIKDEEMYSVNVQYAAARLMDNLMGIPNGVTCKTNDAIVEYIVQAAVNRMKILVEIKS